MLCLPYTNGDHCPSKWHYHFTSGKPIDHFSVAALMASDCDTIRTHAILRLLSSEDVAATILQDVGGSDWKVLDTFQRLNYYTPRYWQPMVAATVLALAESMGLGDECLSFDDLYCHTCKHYVSKTLDKVHWDLLCGTCSHHEDECECCQTCSYHPCECCQICGEGLPWQCECCSYCSQPMGYCECEVCRNCGETEGNCGCGSSSHSYFGSSTKVPWSEREDVAEPMSLPRIAECRNNDIDPVQAAADFYLLDAIKNLVRLADVTGADDRMHLERHNVVRADNMLSALVTSAERSYRNLVDYLAPNFLAYALPAVGGELRYHKAVGKAFKTSSREGAWDKFVDVVERKGAETLFEADKLFLEFGAGAYGGKKWGDAAKVVGQYLAGTMPAWLFVDRVFTLQHNGGCFLNKVGWKRSNRLHWGLSKILYVLNAHAGKNYDGSEDAPTDWTLLTQIASPEVAAMFHMTERHMARIARRFGGTLTPLPRKSHIRNYV